MRILLVRIFFIMLYLQVPRRYQKHTHQRKKEKQKAMFGANIQYFSIPSQA